MARSKDRDGIQKLGDQHYRLSWIEKGSGKRRSRVVHGTLEEAKADRAAIVVSQSCGEYVTPDRLTLAAYLDQWLAAHALRGETKDTTHARYSSLLKGSLVDRLGAIRLQELTEQNIDGYYLWCLRHELTRRGTIVSRETVNKRHKILKKALSDAVRKRLIVRNPADYATAPKGATHRGQAFTRAEAQSVLAAVHDSWVDLPVRIALYTGMRLGEVTGLRWRYVDLPPTGPGKLTVAGIVSEKASGYVLEPYAKTTHSRRTIGIGADLADALRAHRSAQNKARLALGGVWEQNDLVYCGSYGQILRPSKVSARFTPIIRLMEKQGALSTHEATFHTLRHTHATLLLSDGESVHKVSRRLGHSKIQITLDYYAHVMPGDDEGVAAVFDGILSGPFDRTLRIPCASDEDSEPSCATQ